MALTPITSDTQADASPNLDVTVECHGSLYLFELHTADARAWVDYNVSRDATYYGDALVVEWRYARDLAHGMTEDGLTVA